MYPRKHSESPIKRFGGKRVVVLTVLSSELVLLQLQANVEEVLVLSRDEALPRYGEVVCFVCLQ